jgi:ActR/RegA family two-component response regulator
MSIMPIMGLSHLWTGGHMKTSDKVKAALERCKDNLAAIESQVGALKEGIDDTLTRTARYDIDDIRTALEQEMDELDSIIQMIDDDMDAAPSVQWEMPIAV